jgi:hypothetical protein
MLVFCIVTPNAYKADTNIPPSPLGITAQKTNIDIFTTMRTSNLNHETVLYGNVIKFKVHVKHTTLASFNSLCEYKL